MQPEYSQPRESTEVGAVPFGVGALAIGVVALATSLAGAQLPDEPKILPTYRLISTVNVPELDNILEPVPADVTALVSADKALEIAKATTPEAGEASTVGITFAYFTSGQRMVADGYKDEAKAPSERLYENILSWIVAFRGVCVPVYGPPATRDDGRPSCAGSELSVVIDATTGQHIESYAHSE